MTVSNHQSRPDCPLLDTRVRIDQQLGGVMAVKAEDRRVQRTRALLLSALLDLIVERGYEEVSVQDIVDRANVGRSTFYVHFLDKRQLLLSGVERLQVLLSQHAVEPSASVPTDRLLKFSLPLFQHIQANLRFCRALLGSQCSTIVEPQIERFLADILREELAVYVVSDTAGAVPFEVVVPHTVSAFLGVLRWWMGQPTPCAAEEIDRQFRALSVPAITAGLRRSAPTGQAG
jgi:AcrR family transcriptional regulator